MEIILKAFAVLDLHTVSDAASIFVLSSQHNVGWLVHGAAVAVVTVGGAVL